MENYSNYKGIDVTLVVVDKLTKYAHFVTLSHPYSIGNISIFFMDDILKLERASLLVSSSKTHSLLIEVKLHSSTSYHPQSDEV